MAGVINTDIVPCLDGGPDCNFLGVDAKYLKIYFKAHNL